MLDKVTYEYAVIRLVPMVEREEFINIGVIVFSKRKKYLGIKYTVNKPRINALAPQIDTDMIQEYLDAWQQICDGSPKGGFIGTLELALRFRWLVATRSTIIQSSKTHPGLCHNPESILEDLYKMYVV